MEVFVFTIIGVVLYAVNEYQKGQAEDRRRSRFLNLVKTQGEGIEQAVKEKYREVERVEQDQRNWRKLELRFAVPFKPVIEAWHSPDQFSGIQRKGRIIWERLPEGTYIDLRIELFQLMDGHWVTVGSYDEKRNLFDLPTTYQYSNIGEEVVSIIGGMKYTANDDLGVLHEEQHI